MHCIINSFIITVIHEFHVLLI